MGRHVLRKGERKPEPATDIQFYHDGNGTIYIYVINMECADFVVVLAIEKWESIGVWLKFVEGHASEMVGKWFPQIVQQKESGATSICLDVLGEWVASAEQVVIEPYDVRHLLQRPGVEFIGQGVEDLRAWMQAQTTPYALL